MKLLIRKGLFSVKILFFHNSTYCKDVHQKSFNSRVFRDIKEFFGYAAYQKSFNSRVFRDIKEFFGTVEYSETYQGQAGIKEFFGYAARKNPLIVEYSETLKSFLVP